MTQWATHAGCKGTRQGDRQEYLDNCFLEKLLLAGEPLGDRGTFCRQAEGVGLGPTQPHAWPGWQTRRGGHQICGHPRCVSPGARRQLSLNVCLSCFLSRRVCAPCISTASVHSRGFWVQGSSSRTKHLGLVAGSEHTVCRTWVGRRCRGTWMVEKGHRPGSKWGQGGGAAFRACLLFTEGSQILQK